MFKTKNEQDIHLQGLIEPCDVTRHRPRGETSGKREKSFKYFVLNGDSRVDICYSAFLSIYGISDKRVRRLRDLLLLGKSPQDLRGKNTSGNAMPATEILNVKEHIQSFPVKDSHYSGRDYHYLDAKLNLTIMYKLYTEKFPESKISYNYYTKYFRENFSLAFGRPQIDTCCVCEELNIKIKSPSLNNVAKRTAIAEKLVHVRRSKKFYSALRQSATDSKEKVNVLGLAFDYMQNVQLPQIPVQEIFYLRQLSVSVFGIHNLQNDTAVFMVYHEGQANKGPDEVCTFLLNYITEFVPDEVTELHLFSDNCPGQNKNHTYLRLCRALVDTNRFKTVKNFFPIRGHSFLPCDRDFGVVKRALKKWDRLYTPFQLMELIVSSSKQLKFTVKLIETSDIINFKAWWPMFYKKTVLSVETSGRHVPREKRVSVACFKTCYCLLL